MYFVYILRCSDNTFYVGHAKNLDAREKEHNDGHGARYAAARRPASLAYSEAFDSLEKAVLRERQIKRWNRAKKEALIAGNVERFKRLSKRCL